MAIPLRRQSPRHGEYTMQHRYAPYPAKHRRRIPGIHACWTGSSTSRQKVHRIETSAQLVES